MPAPRNWYAVDVGLDTHPRIVEAGPWGSVAFQTAIRLIKRHGVGGRVEDRYVTGAYMARLLGFARDAAEVERLSEGIEAAVAAGLLARAGGFVEAPGWKDWQTDPGKGGRDATRRYATRYGRDTGATLARDERDTGAILLRDEREHVDTDTDTETRVKDSSPPTAPTAPTTSKNEVAHPKPKPKPPPNPDIRTVADAFSAEWKKHDVEVRPAWGPAEGAQAKRLLARAPLAVVLARIPAYWTDPSTAFGTRRGFLDFCSRFDRLGDNATGAARGATNPNDPRHPRWFENDPAKRPPPGVQKL